MLSSMGAFEYDMMRNLMALLVSCLHGQPIPAQLAVLQFDKVSHILVRLWKCERVKVYKM